MSIEQTALQRSLSEAKEKVKELGESVGIEGLKNEKKLHHVFDGFIKGALEGRSAADIFTGSVEKVGQAFRLALPAMLAFTAATEIFNFLKEAAENADKVRESFEKLRTTDVTNASVEQMKDTIKEMRQLLGEVQKESKATKFTNWVLGKGVDEAEAKRGLEQQEQFLEKLKQKKIADDVQAEETKLKNKVALMNSQDPELTKLKIEHQEEIKHIEEKKKAALEQHLDATQYDELERAAQRAFEQEVKAHQEKQATAAAEQQKKEAEKKVADERKVAEQRQHGLDEAADINRKTKEQQEEGEKKAQERHEKRAELAREGAQKVREAAMIEQEIAKEKERGTLSHLHLSESQWKLMHRNGKNMAGSQGADPIHKLSSHMQELISKQTQTNNELIQIKKKLATA